MKHLRDFLSRFKEIQKQSIETKDTIISILESVGILKIKKEDISINNQTIFIKTSPIKKNELFLKKEIILNKIKEKPELKNITRIV